MSKHFIWNCQEERNGLKKGTAALKIQVVTSKFLKRLVIFFSKLELYTSFFKDNKGKFLFAMHFNKKEKNTRILYCISILNFLKKLVISNYKNKMWFIILEFSKKYLFLSKFYFENSKIYLENSIFIWRAEFWYFSNFI